MKSRAYSTFYMKYSFRFPSLPPFYACAVSSFLPGMRGRSFRLHLHGL